MTTCSKAPIATLKDNATVCYRTGNKDQLLIWQMFSDVIMKISLLSIKHEDQFYTVQGRYIEPSNPYGAFFQFPIFIVNVWHLVSCVLHPPPPNPMVT